MKKSKELDLLSEYYRECQYCKEQFMANHQLRRFCLQKYGIPNFCKHRYKVLLHGARLAGENIVVDHRQDIPIREAKAVKEVEIPPTKVPVVEEPKEQFNDNTVSNSEVLLKNISILQQLMQNDKPITLSPKAIISQGLNLNIFDKKRNLPNSTLSFIEIGNYALFWTHKREILITPLNEILWM